MKKSLLLAVVLSASVIGSVPAFATPDATHTKEMREKMQASMTAMREKSPDELWASFITYQTQLSTHISSKNTYEAKMTLMQMNMALRTIREKDNPNEGAIIDGKRVGPATTK